MHLCFLYKRTAANSGKQIESKVNTFILLHRKLLVKQWVKRINQFPGIPKKETGYYSGTKKTHRNY